nr:Heat shock protein Hsp70 [Hymenolepis microstoma]
MSIDLGTDFTKVAVVKPGLPMEIALDSMAKRTIPTLIVLEMGDRLFGNRAVAYMTKNPKIVFAELPSIIGKTLDHPAVKAYQKRYPYHNLVFSSEFHQLAFVVNGKEYTVETLLAMFLKYVKQTAEAFAGSEMKTAVITVPTFFSQSERRAILRAAHLANIDVIQLMSNNLGVALDFIRNNVKLVDDKPVYAFFDVGATATTATIVSYENAKPKGETTGEHPHVFIRGTASDTTLGTNAFIDRLEAHLIKKFKEGHKIDADITQNARTLAKFRKEATRVFKILSANKEIYAAVDEIYDGLDFTLLVSRDELEEMCKDLIERMSSVLQSAIKIAENFSSNVSNDLRDIIIFGGGTRIPAVQVAILSVTNKDAVKRSVNTDEAAALGAVYQAAANTPGFLVKRIVLRDMVNHPIAITFPRINTSADSNNEEFVTRTLFPANSLFPQKRTIKFPHLEKDIAFHVHYDGTPADQSSYLQGNNAILRVNVSGVNEAVENFRQGVNGQHSVKVHLELDANGILQTSEVNLMIVHEEDEKSKIEKFADGISSLFGSGDQIRKDTEQKTTETLPPTTDQPKSSDTEQSDESSTTQSPEPTETTTTTTSAPALQKKIMIHPLTFSAEILDSVNPPSESVGASMIILHEFEAADKERGLLLEARNELERTIYDTRRDIEKDFVEHTTREEIDNLNTITKTIYLWYDDEGQYAPRSAIEEHLDKLREAVSPIKRRIKAFTELPQALTALEELLTRTAEPIQAVMELNSASNTSTASEYIMTLNDSLTEEEENRKTGLPIYSLSDVESMEKIIAETRTFLKETNIALNECDKRADPPVRLVTVTEKTSDLAAKLDYYGHKGEIWFATYKRLFVIKRETLANAAKMANVTIDATEVNETLSDSPDEEDEEIDEPSVTEEPTEVPKPETSTPRSEL